MMEHLGGVTRNMHPLIEIYYNYGAKDEIVISNGVVCQIFSNISFVPARTSAYIAKALNIDPKTVEWHAKKLIDANLVSLNNDRNKYWLKGILQENELKYFEALNFSASYVIISSLIDKKEIKIDDLELNKVTASKKIKLLENVGFINENRKGKEVYLTINEEFFKFRNLLKWRANIFITNYLRRLKLSKIYYEILNVTDFSISIDTNQGMPIILSRDPLFTVIKYG